MSHLYQDSVHGEALALSLYLNDLVRVVVTYIFSLGGHSGTSNDNILNNRGRFNPASEDLILKKEEEGVSLVVKDNALEAGRRPRVSFDILSIANPSFT